MPSKTASKPLSASPFRFKLTPSNDLSDYTLFNCFSNKRDYSNYFLSITCTTLFSNPVYDAGSYYNLDRLVLSSCHKIHNVRLPDDIVNGENYFSLTWSELTCGSCEKEGKKCRLKSNVGKELETECIDKLNSFLYNWSTSSVLFPDHTTYFRGFRLL